jgi:hypothetical protein
LAVVRLDDREVLVGITPSGFTLLDVAGVRASAQSSVEGPNT